MKSKSYAAYALDFVLLLVIVWVLVGYVRYAQVAPPSFDGAMNLNTALSFVQGHGYGFFYNEFFPFPAQTDGPFTLPAGLLMWWAGVTPLTTQAVNLCYLIGTVIVGFLLLWRITWSSTFALAGMVVLLATPGVATFAVGGYGEIPSLFWLLLSLLVLAPALDKDRPSGLRLASGGVALALSLLTKAVALLMVAPAAVLFAAIFALWHRPIAARLGWFAAGLVLPVLGWEVFRLVQIGSLAGYTEWWRLQFGQTLLQSGAHETLHADRGLVAKGAEHLGILAGEVGTPAPELMVFLLLPWLVVLGLLIHRWRRGDLGDVFCLAACGAISVLYFVWWLLVEQTQMAWLRRIVDGLAVQQLLLVAAVVTLIRACRPGGGFALPRRLFSAVLLVALLYCGAFLVLNGETITAPPTPTAADRDTLPMAARLRALPADATLFGFGWWKAPVLALFSGRPMMNYYYWDPAKIDALPHKYLVLDPYTKGLSQQDVQEILAAGTAHVVADGPGGTIYELDKVLPYRPFTDAERDPQKLRAGFRIADGLYAATRGFYGAEGASAWVKPNAALLLRRTDQTALSLAIYVPPQLMPEPPDAKLVLHVASAGCLDASVPIEPGVRTILLPLTCAPSAAPQAMEVSLFVNGHVPTVRQIDADPRRLGYLVTDIHLQGP